MKVGIGKVPVKISRQNLPLYGYPIVGNYSEGIEMDLHARAFIFKSDDKTIALINLESGFISHHLKKALIQKCNDNLPESDLKMENLMLCAQNTHSAPGGHSHYAFHNITSRGFRPDVFECYVNACFEAIRMAINNIEPCHLYFNADEIDQETDIGFNRSIEAYNQNPDVLKQDEMNTHIAINRMMRQVRICTDRNSDKGLINWFGVQANSISDKNTRVHSDNKGYAASMLENDQSTSENFIAAFCQEASADISPNYYGRAKWWPRGRYEDDFKSAYSNGFFHFEKARSLMEKEEFQIPLSSNIEYFHAFFDLSAIDCHPRYTHDGLSHSTGPACLGKAFMEGSSPDIEGVDAFSSSFFQVLIQMKELWNQLPFISNAEERARWNKLKENQYPKKILVELQQKRILGYRKLNKLTLPKVLSDISEEIIRQYNNGALKEHSWTPVILPLQIFRIGEIAILGFPGDLSTTAGERLRRTVLEILEPSGILDVIISTYSNEHAGYATTREEYMEQTFEGGFTLFGQHTLAGFQTCFGMIAKKITTNEAVSIKQIEPPDFSEEELLRRTFRKKN